jgi:putative glutathione S-transferase
MGLLVNGQWQDEWYDTSSTGGEFVRQDSQFRHQIGEPGFDAEAGRYHLFISLACPWAHRTLIFRKLKGLENIIGVTIVDAKMLEHGWTFSDVSENNPIEGIDYLHQVYTTAKPSYTGRVTVPVLWDKQRRTIVNNESAEIIRILNSAFNELTGENSDYYPLQLKAAIDEINQLVYDDINNGVYRAGFATSQPAYEAAVQRLFDGLDVIEQRLGQQRYLLGQQITEADWRLFTTLIRFDAVYYSHFKANLKHIEDYPNLSNYIRELYQIEGIAGTVNIDHNKTHYYFSQITINPTQIVPVGPVLDYTRAHNRDQFQKDLST